MQREGSMKKSNPFTNRDTFSTRHAQTLYSGIFEIGIQRAVREQICGFLPGQ